MLTLFPELAYAQALVHVVRARVAGEQDREAGVSTVEWVLISAILVTLVLAVGAILINKWSTKATSIPVTTP